MGDIDDLSARGNAQDDTLHGAYEPVLCAEIGRQCDNAHDGIIFADCGFETNIMRKVWQKLIAK